MCMKSHHHQICTSFILLIFTADINECEQGLCSHDCENNDGSFECSCPNGFVVVDDQLTCEGI